MQRLRIPTAFAFVAVVACASTPNPTPPEAPAPAASSPKAPTVDAPAPSMTPSPAPSSSSTPTPETAIAPASSAAVAPDPDDPMTPLPPPAESERTPGVKSGSIAVRGQLHPTRVTAAMRKAYPAVRDCHKKAPHTKTVADEPVRVLLHFVIDQAGAMTELTDETTNPDALSSCVLRAVSTVKFQPPKRGVVHVTYSLELTKP